MTAEPWRVAQVAVGRGPADKDSRGSGYLVAPGRVLTAAHVVAGASVVRVRLDVGQDTQIEVEAGNWWADPAGHEGTDLAVIMIPEIATGGRVLEPARFGRVSDCAAVLPVEAFGFPLFKLRGDPGAVGHGRVFRDFEQAAAHAPVAANRRQGTLAVYLDDPLPGMPSEGVRSPWEGMSGAAVWAAGRIVGVVAEHHPSEGTGRLTARRVDRAYEQLPGPDLGVLAELLGLPPTAGGLADVVPAERGQLVRSAYLTQVRDIAPDELVGRESELEDWAEFCAGTDLYAWWQAAPWAGKSALASWFVTHPPAGVDVVSFFITGRLSGQADSDAFLDSMIEQLQALHPVGPGPVATLGARAGTWLNLLESAAARARERGRRLVVVVDGLDEDEAGAAPLRGKPSIASLLPRRPPPGARCIITSRPDPGLPDDLPVGHPLRAVTPRQLPVSRVASDIGIRARQELRDLLTGDQATVDVVGYIAGSGGGLTGSDLSDLTGAPPHKLESVLRGVSGRSLQALVLAEASAPAVDRQTQVYLFAHETLRVSAEAQLGRDLTRYRQKVHAWIDFYARAGWPGATPGYAIRGYPGLLATVNDTTRLLALARDPRRHAFLLQATGNDYAALIEIKNAQALIAGQSVLDMQALVALAACRHVISIRTQAIPAGLPIAWAQLDRLDHAEALARTITSPYDQARALTGLTTAAAQAGDLDRAEALARTITDTSGRVLALGGVAIAAARAGDLDRARRLAASAEALARTITDTSDQSRALAGLATAAAQAGDLDRAEALARTITNTSDRGRALSGVATAAAQAGDLDRARRLAADAETLARTDPSQDQALTELVTATAQAGDLDHAEALARTITIPRARARALAGLVTAAAQAGDLDRARRLAADAEALARTITDPDDQGRALAGLVTAVAQVGDLDRARRLAAHAEALTHTNTGPRADNRALADLITATAQAGDLDRARRLAADAEARARTITHPSGQAQALARLVTAVAQVGDLDRARRLAADAEARARTITNASDQTWALTELVSAAARAGDLDHAEAVARTITDATHQAQALTGLVIAAARAGDLDRAGRVLARAIISDLPGIWWVGAVSRLFPSAIQDAWNILSSM